MLLTRDAEDQVAHIVLQSFARCTFPFQQLTSLGGAPEFGTAFLFNDLVKSTRKGDQVREYLLTADPLTYASVAEVTVRPELAEPAGVASDILAMPRFEELWTHRADIGIAITATQGLHEHARAKGWRWATQEVTDGVAARADTVAAIGALPISAFVLGHLVNESSSPSRPLELIVGRVTRDGDRLLFASPLPAGFAGAPVFCLEARGSDGGALRCLGLALPGDGKHPVATFDRIRDAIGDLTAHSA